MERWGNHDRSGSSQGSLSVEDVELIGIQKNMMEN